MKPELLIPIRIATYEIARDYISGFCTALHKLDKEAKGELPANCTAEHFPFYTHEETLDAIYDYIEMANYCLGLLKKAPAEEALAEVDEHGDGGLYFADMLSKAWHKQAGIKRPLWEHIHRELSRPRLDELPIAF